MEGLTPPSTPRNNNANVQTTDTPPDVSIAIDGQTPPSLSLLERAGNCCVTTPHFILGPLAVLVPLGGGLIAGYVEHSAAFGALAGMGLLAVETGYVMISYATDTVSDIFVEHALDLNANWTTHAQNLRRFFHLSEEAVS